MTSSSRPTLRRRSIGDAKLQRRLLALALAVAGLAFASTSSWHHRSAMISPSVFERSVTRTVAVAAALSGLSFALVAVAAQLRRVRWPAQLPSTGRMLFPVCVDHRSGQIRFLRTLHLGGRIGP